MRVSDLVPRPEVVRLKRESAGGKVQLEANGNALVRPVSQAWGVTPEAELRGAHDQLAATAEILRVISTSPTDVQRVFDTIVRSAVSLCGGLFANVFRFDGELLHFIA